MDPHPLVLYLFAVVLRSGTTNRQRCVPTDAAKPARHGKLILWPVPFRFSRYAYFYLSAPLPHSPNDPVDQTAVSPYVMILLALDQELSKRTTKTENIPCYTVSEYGIPSPIHHHLVP